MKHDDAIAAALANRSFVYTYLWRAFAAEPDEAFLNAVVDDATLEECKLLAGEESRAAQAQEALAAFVSNTPDALDTLKGEYTKLFVGPGKLPAPPWESVYVCGEDLLFQPSTLEVREAYRSAGYQAAGYPHEADDHLATELDFMGALAKRTQAAYEEGDEDAFRLLISKQVYFLGTHLNGWLSQYTERLLDAEKPKVSDFYRHFSVLAQELCLADSAALEEIARFEA